MDEDSVLELTSFAHEGNKVLINKAVFDYDGSEYTVRSTLLAIYHIFCVSF